MVEIQSNPDIDTRTYFNEIYFAGFIGPIS